MDTGKSNQIKMKMITLSQDDINAEALRCIQDDDGRCSDILWRATGRIAMKRMMQFGVPVEEVRGEGMIAVDKALHNWDGIINFSLCVYSWAGSLTNKYHTNSTVVRLPSSAKYSKVKMNKIKIVWTDDENLIHMDGVYGIEPAVDDIYGSDIYLLREASKRLKPDDKRIYDLLTSDLKNKEQYEIMGMNSSLYAFYRKRTLKRLKIIIDELKGDYIYE